uniref:PIN domain-containing protein n=1 Tax=Candidatus Kentrum sp. LPFa TaxID=2126335 RepID=A0A450WM16_9GAMM|nr:MAG: hypothetical protein BECKLPF1236A_GA0070988_1018710 [Candidatus Kentron sp. LPFa]VFK33296.1 MAG: hypothetical protein BECKLPF1236C_GA0070990_1020010 [Candidatus Kentron sp. LPFa]
MVIVDTGSLVAYLSQRDKYHAWICNQLEYIGFPLLTCEAVLTETCFLIGRNGGDAGDPIEMLNRVAPDSFRFIPRIRGHQPTDAKIRERSHIACGQLPATNDGIAA